MTDELTATDYNLVKLTAEDYRMKRSTAERILCELSQDALDDVTLRRAYIIKSDGRKHERFCMFLGGCKITSAADWRAYQSPAGFTRLMISQLR